MNCVKRIGVILAGGLGKRMNSHLPKPAHKIGAYSMLQYVIHKMDKINITKIYVVFGQKGDLLKESVAPNEKIIWVHQDPQLGTEQRKIQYINAGLYCFTFEALAQHLHTLENNNAQSEYYLTDLPPKVADVKILEIDDEEEIYNVFKTEQLEYAETIMHKFI